MSTILVLYHLAKADFLERVRRSSFLFVLVAAMYLGYIYLPGRDAGYVTVAIDNARGIYNSAWVGAVCSLMSSTFISLIGFYLIRNSVARDYQTRVGQILAGTPMTKFEYLFAKMVSNFAVLAAVVLVMLASAGVVQIIRGEDTSINLWLLVGPTLMFALPFLLIVAAIAVLFEVTPVLRSSAGNVIYFFVWNLILVASILSSEEREGVIVHAKNDPAGFSQILSQITQAAHAALPGLNNNTSMGFNITDNAIRATFVWNGMEWSPTLIFGRLIWVLAAVGIVLVATAIFRRFESVEVIGKKRKSPASLAESDAAVAASPVASPVRLSSLDMPSGFAFTPLLMAELRLLLRSANRWWLLGAAALIVVTLVTPLDVSRQYVFPIAWIWPLALWSSMGTREKKFGTEQVLFSCPRPLSRQLPAIWIAGIAVALVTGAGMLIRFSLAGDTSGLFACVVGMLFIPTLALSFGVLSGSQLLFEAVYVALWYIGPMNHVPFLDYMGASTTITPNNSLIFLLAIPCLWLLAFFARRRQISP